MTTREEVLHLLQGIQDARNSQKKLEKDMKVAQTEIKPAEDERAAIGNEQAQRYRNIITKYDLTSKKSGNNIVLNVDLYGIVLFKMVYDNSKGNISYGLTTTAKDFVNWDSSKMISKIEEYIMAEFPGLRQQLAELHIEKGKCEYNLARLYAEYSLTSFLKLKIRKQLKGEIKKYREELLWLEKVADPIEKRANKLSDPKMKELLAEAYQVQADLKECLEHEVEYTNAWENWKSKNTNVQQLKIQAEELRYHEGVIINELICKPESVSELISISKSRKVNTKTKSLAKEIIKTAAQQQTYQSYIRRI